MLAPLALLPLLFLLAVRARRLAFRLLSARQPGEQLRVAFLHPDLGIGGADTDLGMCRDTWRGCLPAAGCMKSGGVCVPK